MLKDPFHFRDRAYWRNLLTLGVPIALQNLISSSLNLVDNLLVGQLGEKAMGGLALANQISFLVILFTYGISSGAAVFASQYWGARKVSHVHQTQGTAILLTLIPALVFCGVAALAPGWIIGLYTTDTEIIALGASYLRISAFTYPLIALGFSWSMILRALGRVRIPLVMSFLAMVLNIALSIVLIFGLFGLPALGVAGAALGTLAARLVEVGGMILLSYLRRCPNACSLGAMFRLGRGFLWKFLKTSLPVLGNDLGWALGITALVAIYAQRGAPSLAAASIVDTVGQFLNIFIFGSVNAVAISTGTLIGQGRINRTRLLARRATATGFGIGLVLALVLGTTAGLLPLLFNISAQARIHAHHMLVVLALALPFRSLLYHQTVGLFRGAGDTRFPLLVEVGGLWILGYLPAVLLARLGEFPVEILFATAIAHEVVLSLVCLLRFRRPGWIRHLHH